MKKVLLVTRPIAPPWDEASKNFAYFLARNVSGVEFTILTHGQVAELPNSVRQESIYTANDFNLSQKWKLFRYLRRNRAQFDVVHYLFTPTKLNSFLLKHLAAPSKAATLQTVATLREDLYSDADLKKILFADQIVTYSDYARRKLEKLGFKNVARIYPGIDLKIFAPAPRNIALAATYEILTENFVVTYPGEYVRLGATDDIVNMIIQHSRILDENKVKFLFACRIKNSADAQKKEEVKEKLTKANALDLVIFTDTFADMPQLYNLSDLVIFPVQNMQGKFDVPLVIIEAMACQKPVIVSDLPILKEFSTPKTSVIIKAGDQSALMTEITNFIAKAERKNILGQAARSFVEKEFDIRLTAEQYQKIYVDL